jgi:hypothetical protein
VLLAYSSVVTYNLKRSLATTRNRHTITSSTLTNSITRTISYKTTTVVADTVAAAITALAVDKHC